MSIQSIDTSLYTTPYAAGLESLQSTDSARTYEKEQLPNIAAVDEETPKVDLSNYYSNVQPTEMNADVKSGVSQASQNLSNAITKAIENGSLNTQDAVNLQKAKAAYEASINVAKAINLAESSFIKSTFELAV